MIVFCGTKRALSNAYNYLNSKNLFVAQIHGDLKQHEREVNCRIYFSLKNLRLNYNYLRINVQ